MIGLLALMPAVASQAAETMGPLRVCEANPRYFATSDASPVYLAGGHDGWELQDYAWGDANDGVLFDWEGLLDFQVEYGHNVIRLWCVGHTKITDDDADVTAPMPYERVEGGDPANDSQPKFDLDRFSEAYFTRLRARVEQARERGLYVIVMLFQGWSIEDKRGRVNPWPYHPFQRANNVNGVDGDLDGDGQGQEMHTWQGEEHELTRRQRAYVRRVIDTVNDLDNALYEIANESSGYSTEWQHRMVDYIHEYENAQPFRHPVGMTCQYTRGPSGSLRESNADWISPCPEGGYRDDPPAATGAKVIISDTDHLFGLSCRDYAWVWKTFLRGNNVLYMDAWTLERDGPKREQVRRAIGVTRSCAERITLSRALPLPELADSGYCLADPGLAYLAWAPGGAVTLDLSGAGGELVVEWVDPVTGDSVEGESVPGGKRRSFKAPFEGDAALYLECLP